VDAAACGFDFRAIVESNLGIPVLYCKHTNIRSHQTQTCTKLHHMITSSIASGID
jgi:hypothetical protein